MCVYNVNTGYKVVSLNREVNHPDIAAYNIAFDDNTHEIFIKKPIEINSNEKDSVVAVANFIEKNPAIKTQVLQINPGLLDEAKIIRNQKEIERAKLTQVNHVPQRTNN
jgi:hypothetical protein